MPMPTWPITHALVKRFQDLKLTDVTIGDCLYVAFLSWLDMQEQLQAERRRQSRKKTAMDNITRRQDAQ